MSLLVYSAIVMLAGLALLLDMVVRIAEPGLVLSLTGYAMIVTGMMLGLAGAVLRKVSRR